MLGENIRNLRKARGYSQETLAQELNVVRQTVSKWEKGLSVPDADMLEKMAGIFEVSVDALLGSTGAESKSTDENEVARQLAILNEQLARQSRSRKRIWKTVLICIGAAFLLYVILAVLSFGAFSVVSDSMTETVTEEVEIFE